jgi:hypothetical protein
MVPLQGEILLLIANGFSDAVRDITLRQKKKTKKTPWP